MQLETLNDLKALKVKISRLCGAERDPEKTNMLEEALKHIRTAIELFEGKENELSKSHALMSMIILSEYSHDHDVDRTKLV